MIYSQPIKIYKNIDNPLRFEFRDQDRKKVNINGYRIFLYVFNSSTVTSNIVSVAESRNQAQRWQDTDDSTMLDLDDGSTLFDQTNQFGERNTSLLAKELYILDDGSTKSSRGIATTVISKHDLHLMNSDSYYYSMKAVLPGTFDNPVYTDVNFGARGVIQVIAGHYPPNI